jgi:hypothetical protein
MGKWFGREPSWWIGSVSQPILILLLMATPWDDALKGALSGLITLLGGAVLAATVSAEKVIPLVAGVAQAVFAVALALGHPFADNIQQLVLGLISAVTAAYIRDKVVAPVSLDGYRARRGVPVQTERAA